MDLYIAHIFIWLLILTSYTGYCDVVIQRQPAGGFNLTPGQRYSMVCHHPDADAQLGWYLNSQPVTTSPIFTVTPSSDENGIYLKLTIHAASRETRGRYQCSNQNDFFDYDFRVVDVSQVFNPGDATPVNIIKPEDNSTTIGEGGALVIKCESGEDSQVTWHHNDRQMEPSSRMVITSPENQLHVLTIMNVGMHDAGTYRCQNAANYYNRDYVDVDVIKSNWTHSLVISEPVNSRAFIVKGTTFSATCRGIGSRHLEWRHDGLTIKHSKRIIITSTLLENDVMESQLKMTDVQMSDGGDYQCKDTDDFTLADRRSLIVVVPRKVPPVQIIRPSHNETSVTEGGSFSITCVAGIKSRLSWSINGLRLRPKPTLTLLATRDKVRHTLRHVLTVMEATSHDVGRYVCQDSRDLLNYDAIEISLAQAPTEITLRIEKPDTNYISVLPGHYLGISCVGNKDLEMRWRHNGIIFDPRRRSGFSLTLLEDTQRNSLSSMLTLIDVSKNDSGVFTCEDASNYLNSDSVGIRVPTPVNITTGSLTLLHGDLLQLPCRADYGTALQWLLNDTLVHSRPGVSIYHAADVLQGKVTSILTFADTNEHSGKYTCQDRFFTGNSMDVTVEYVTNVTPTVAAVSGTVEITSGHHIQIVPDAKLTLRCKASSASLNLYWTFNDVELLEDGSDPNLHIARITLHEGEQWLSVIVQKSSVDWAGVYKCSARMNPDLADSAKVEIVNGKPTG